MKRKHFLKSLLGGSAFLGIPFNSYSFDNDSIEELINNTKLNTNGNMFSFSDKKIKKVRVGIIGVGNRGSILLQMFQYLVEKNHSEILAISDISEKKVHNACDKLSEFQDKKADLYYKTKEDWKKVCNRDDIDLILIDSQSIKIPDFTAGTWKTESPLEIMREI